MSDDDFPELSHISTEAQAQAIADALLEASRNAADQIRLVVSPEEVR